MNIESPSRTGLSRSQKRAPTGRLLKAARLLSTALLRMLTLLALLLLALPVAVLPISSKAPAPVWITLALVVVSLVILLFRYHWHWTLRAVGATLAGKALIIIVATAASQIYAATPPITGTDGNPPSGSIATLEEITLNGSWQWITIRGQDETKPILLNLGMGGPGGGGFMTRSLFEPLEKVFVIVSWDETGIWPGRQDQQHPRPDGIVHDRIPPTARPGFHHPGGETGCAGVPFFVERDDMNAMSSLVKGYSTFDQSTHSPLFEEPHKVQQILEKDVLKRSNHLSDGN
jgi:hypothetical protein